MTVALFGRLPGVPEGLQVFSVTPSLEVCVV